MEKEAIYRETKKTIELLENTTLNHNQRHSLETYLISLANENE